jgi:multisubunit Na+/H+ antiporter MnhG subunit
MELAVPLGHYYLFLEDDFRCALSALTTVLLPELALFWGRCGLYRLRDVQKQIHRPSLAFGGGWVLLLVSSEGVF